MNGRIAKIIRKKVYGAEGASRARQYEAREVKSWVERFKDALGKMQEVVQVRHQVTAGLQRALYQNRKKVYKRGGGL